MSDTIKITVVVDDSEGSPKLFPEHGLSFWVETPAGAFLFDTGQGEALRGNAGPLGIRLADVDTVVLSHGHYDHTGGLIHLLDSESPPRIYAHPTALIPHYRKCDVPPHKFIGMPEEVRCRLADKPGMLTRIDKPQAIVEDVWATGPIPRKNDFENTGGPFFTDATCTHSDLIEDDQAVWMSSAQGIIVLLGCAHSGVVNTLDYIASLVDRKRIHAVIGGMHLQNADENRLEKTLQGLARYGIEVLAPCHCTGRTATSLLRDRMPDTVVPCVCGSTFVFAA